MAEWSGARTDSSVTALRGVWVRDPLLLGHAALPPVGVSVAEYCVVVGGGDLVVGHMW